MPFKPGVPELIIILVIILLIFGASKVPQIGGSIGKGIREFRKGVGGAEESKPRPKRRGGKANKV